GPRGPTTNTQGQVGPPEPILAPNLNIPKNGQKDHRTKIGHFSTSDLWQPPEATNSSPARFPLSSGEELSFTNVLCTKESGMVHIRYNIPLCTKFAQQSNGDVFRTK
ncbi:hypothetical protein O181_120753, partial [Austropuccinia psidii MF-1]|nr:hypothetical protein [Austropuccinia psidii MF-1]